MTSIVELLHHAHQHEQNDADIAELKRQVAGLSRKLAGLTTIKPKPVKRPKPKPRPPSLQKIVTEAAAVSEAYEGVI
jgi:hypothetical protein